MSKSAALRPPVFTPAPGAPRESTAIRRLQGKIAVVTGGTQGIGRAIVRRFAIEGAKVYFCAPDDRGADSLAAELATAGGETPVFVQADVGSPAQIARLITRAARPQGRIDILVNNAAVGIFRTCEQLSLAEWSRAMDINVRSCWLTAKLAWPHLKASGEASIIALSSVHARHTSPACMPYAATKAAVSSLMRNLAIDGGPFGIRANTLCPGLIRTENNAGDFSGSATARARYRRVLVNETLGRIGEPDDVAGAACFLAGPDAAFVTGTELFVDGGAHARLYGNVYEEVNRLQRAAGRKRRRTT